MISLPFKIAVGVLLTGCTVNNMHLSSIVDLHPPAEIILAEKVQTHRAETIAQNAINPILPVAGNTHIRPDCDVYVPLPVPKPTRIDFRELAAAATTAEINAIALRNLKALHVQMNGYAADQQKHYANYKKRCVIK